MGEFIKFACVGVLNTVVDLAVLNALLFVFGAGEHGGLYVVFKSVSFLAAVINSFFLNKYWVFAMADGPKAKQSALFFGVSIAGLLMNVGISFAVFSLLSRFSPLSPELAANLGALFGSGAVFLLNFAGYKLVVFKKNKTHE